MFRLTALLTALMLALTSPALASDFSALKARLAGDGFGQPEVQALFDSPAVKFSPEPMGGKLLELYAKKYGSEVVRQVQARLADLGYYFGEVTGQPDFLLRAAIRAFQTDHSLTLDTRASQELLALVTAESQKASPETSQRLKDLAASGPPQVYEVVLQPERLAEAMEFFQANKDVLEQVRARYGVPPEAAVGLLTVETRVGKYLGDNLALANLASMCAGGDFSRVEGMFAGENLSPERRAWLAAKAGEKAAWAYTELKALLTYARQNNLDLTKMPGSIYGAIGISQFMPSSVLKWGVGGPDGRVDLFRVPDALFSMANFLRAHGFTGNLSDEDTLRQALYRYNHSEAYVNTIMAVCHYLHGQPAKP